jgi:hypothetical protein
VGDADPEVPADCDPPVPPEGVAPAPPLPLVVVLEWQAVASVVTATVRTTARLLRIETMPPYCP